MADALIDSNVFLHAQAHDDKTAECRAFLDTLSEGSRTAVLESVVVHELTYIWRRYFKDVTKSDIADYVRGILSLPGITGETEFLADVLERWRDSNIGFVDCLLAERALSADVPVYTKNVRDLRSQGAEVPDPLPS